jgi:hypothetical protein
MISYHYSEELDAAKRPSASFTSLPVRLRKDDSLSQRASAEFQSEWNNSASQKVVFGSQGIFGHLLSLILPECPPKMVPVFTKFFDYAFLENGKVFLWFDELQHLTNKIYWKPPVKS